MILFGGACIDQIQMQCCEALWCQSIRIKGNRIFGIRLVPGRKYLRSPHYLPCFGQILPEAIGRQVRIKPIGVAFRYLPEKERFRAKVAGTFLQDLLPCIPTRRYLSVPTVREPVAGQVDMDSVRGNVGSYGARRGV